MIADIYKCPECGTTVYLAKDEYYCPLCGQAHRRDMKRKKQNVDLSEDFSLEDDAQYAHFGHLIKVLNVRFGDKAGLYAMDCWKHAWDATKTDSENVRNVNAFIDNPNAYVMGIRNKPMTKEELKAELERIMKVILSKSKIARNAFEAQENLCNSFEKNSPIIRFFIKKDFTYVAAEACFSHTHMTKIYNYAPVERDRPVPKAKDGYFVFTRTLPTDICLKKYVIRKAARMVDDIVYECFRKRRDYSWLEKLWFIGPAIKDWRAFNERTSQDWK